MSSLVIPDGYGEARIEWQVPGNAGPGLTVLGFTDGDPIEGADQVALAIRDRVKNDICPQMANAYFLATVTVNINRTGNIEQGQATGLDNGSLTGAAMPPNVTYLIRKRTGFAGRKFRGRWYLPGVVEGDADAAGVLSSTRQLALQTAMTLFAGDMITDGHDVVLLHSSAPPGPSVITGLLVEQTVATQRRRLR